jgi:hypothetical protein
MREMSEAEQLAANAVDKAMAAQGEKPTIEEADGLRAGYKIEITFGPGRSTFKDYPAFVSLWESGKHFHGGGDSLMYFCFDCRVAENPAGVWQRLMAILDKKEPSNRIGCGHPIPAAAMGNGIAICPHCNATLNTEYLMNPLPFWGSSQDLSKLVARYFHALKDNADVYCKYHPTDIRYKGFEAAKGFEMARRLKAMFIYPLANILKDTSAGATLEGRFQALFNA